MKRVWYINIIGVILSMIGIIQLGNDFINLFIILGLTIQTIAVTFGLILRYKAKKGQ